MYLFSMRCLAGGVFVVLHGCGCTLSPALSLSDICTEQNNPVK